MKLLNKKKDLIVLLTSMVALILLGIVCYLLYVNRSTDVQIIDTSKGVFKVRGDGKTSVFTGDSWKELYSVRRDTTYDTYNVEAQGLYFNDTFTAWIYNGGTLDILELGVEIELYSKDDTIKRVYVVDKILKRLSNGQINIEGLKKKEPEEEWSFELKYLVVERPTFEELNESILDKSLKERFRLHEWLK
ncbi:hypothetical protein [Ekhidna sp.]|uniref:hypothetical protein n=1 Tax=Ekhidna sp. TaxID=2608089 RepID=UPI003B5A925A